MQILKSLVVVLLGTATFLLIFQSLWTRSLPVTKEQSSFIMYLTYYIIMFIVLGYFITLIFENQKINKIFVISIITGFIVAITIYILCITHIAEKITSKEAIQNYILQSGKWAIIIFIVFQFLQVVILPIPGSLSIAAGVALFGAWGSAVYSFIGILLGSFVAFYLGRKFGTKGVAWIVGESTLKKWLVKMKGKDYLLLTLMFLLPLFPDDILCFIAGLSSMSWVYFTIMIMISRLISTFTTAFSFEFIPLNEWWGILIWVIMLTLICYLFYYVYKHSDDIDKWIKTKFSKRA